MGLDITYYKDLKPVDCVFNADGEPIDPETREELQDCFRPYVNESFASHDDIDGNAVYLFAESGHFRAGSYSGYNRWREQLAELAGYPAKEGADECHKHSESAWAATGGPFWELVHFSDCEGAIGPKTSAKLAKDFAEFQDKVDTHQDPRFASLYAEWREAFEVASQNGAVAFR